MDVSAPAGDEDLWSAAATEVPDLAAIVSRVVALEARADAQQSMLAEYVVAADRALQSARVEMAHNRSADQRMVFGLFDELLATLAKDFGVTRSEDSETTPSPEPLPLPSGAPVEQPGDLRFIQPYQETAEWLAVAI